MRVFVMVAMLCAVAGPGWAQSVQGGQGVSPPPVPGPALPALPQAVAGTLGSAVGLTAGFAVVIVVGVAAPTNGTK